MASLLAAKSYKGDTIQFEILKIQDNGRQRPAKALSNPKCTRNKTQSYNIMQNPNGLCYIQWLLFQKLLGLIYIGNIP